MTKRKGVVSLKLLAYAHNNYCRLTRTKEGWEPVPPTEGPQVQFAAYGTSLTKKQFQKLVEKIELKNAKRETE